MSVASIHTRAFESDAGIPAIQRRLRAAPELSIVIPTYNEAKNVALVVAALDSALQGIDWEVLFVDDDSADGTASEVSRLAQADSRVRCIRRIGRRGLSGAVIEGMLSVSSGIVAVMDGDLQHDETAIPRMLEKIKDGADIVIASRFGGHEMEPGGLSTVRRAGSTMATRIARRMLGISASDPLSGFFMIRRGAIHNSAPKLSTHGFKILLDILASSDGKLRTAEVPFTFRTRKHGHSKLDGLVILDYLGLVLAKLTGDAVSLRFIAFGIVGATGLVVHLLVLKAALAGGIAFTTSQAMAAYIAMTGNFFLNNALTYRDRRLRGLRLLTGLATFCAICSIGALANVGAAQLIYSNEGAWWVAGIAGAIMGAIFNYVATSHITWRRT